MKTLRQSIQMTPEWQGQTIDWQTTQQTVELLDGLEWYSLHKLHNLFEWIRTLNAPGCNFFFVEE